MPFPFPAKHLSLGTLLKQEGWKREPDSSFMQNQNGDLSASFWTRGKHAVLLVEQEGKGDTLWRPVADPHQLAVTIASRRKQKNGKGRQPAGHKLEVVK